MAVFVDPWMNWPKTANWPYGGVSHLYADDSTELHEFAASLGLKREWCSDHTQPGSQLLHYDLNYPKREQAVKYGAVEVDHAHGEGYYRSLKERKREIERATKRPKKKKGFRS